MKTKPAYSLQVVFFLTLIFCQGFTVTMCDTLERIL